MPCYHPLLAIPAGINNKSGKRAFRIVGYKDSVLNDPYLPDGVIEIPCGKCIGCRLERSRQWANRCSLELQYHDSAYFATLTYDDDHVPLVYGNVGEDGDYCHMSLRKRDLQLWLKRLRRAFPDDHIRFFACGEYGDQTLRPHYHAILFGLHLDDLKVKRVDAKGFVYYTSEKFDSTWTSEKKCEGSITPLTQNGMCELTSVTWNTCAYVARYITKKLTGPEGQIYKDLGIEPPFLNMSRRPGIGRQYYDDHPEVFDYEFINIGTAEGGKKFRPPKYFERLLESDDPERAAARKAAKQEYAAARKEAMQAQTDLDYLSMLAVQEQAHQDRAKKLERKL